MVFAIQYLSAMALLISGIVFGYQRQITEYHAILIVYLAEGTAANSKSCHFTTVLATQERVVHRCHCGCQWTLPVRAPFAPLEYAYLWVCGSCVLALVIDTKGGFWSTTCV